MSFVHQITPLILPFIILLILALAAPIVREAYRMLRSVRVRLRSRAAKAAIDGLTVLAGTAVAAAAEEVRNLKDPTKPGEWNRATAARIRDRVIGEVMELGRDLIAQLKLLGVLDAGSVYDLLERMVEAQVERLRHLELPAVSTITAESFFEVAPAEPSAPARPTLEPSHLRASTISIAVAPPPSTGERGSVRVGAVAVLLALGLGALAVGAVLSGCPQVREGVMRITPGVPEPSVCVPDAQRCAGAVPEVCSRNQTGTTRWWPSLAPRIDGTPRVCAGGCSVSDAGLAGCDPVLPNNPFTADGGAR